MTLINPNVGLPSEALSADNVLTSRAAGQTGAVNNTPFDQTAWPL